MHPDERPNGHAHCLQLLLGSSESVPVIDGELMLGAWQRLFLVELDGPRPQREVLVQVLGEAEPAPADWSRPAAQVGQPRFDLARRGLNRVLARTPPRLTRPAFA